MEPTIIEDNILEYEPFEEDGSVLMVAESSWRGFATELQELHFLKGAQFINQLKLIIYYGEFHPVEVLIFKGNKTITVKRGWACNPDFNRIFRKRYEK